MDHNELDEDIIYNLQNLRYIKESPDILMSIKFDVTPQILMEPRFQSLPEDLKKLGQIAGYMFYIETECDPPALMLMKTGKTDITSTIAKIDEIPVEMVLRAVEAPVHPPVFGMYAVTDEIKIWLKKELGL